MGIKAENITSALGTASSFFLMGTSVQFFAQAATAVPYLGAGLAKLSGLLGAITPSFLSGAGGMIAGLVGGSAAAPLLVAAAAVGLAIAVPWALNNVGKLIDGAISRMDAQIEHFKVSGEVSRERARAGKAYQQEYEHLPAVTASSGLTSNSQAVAEEPWHPANDAQARGVSFRENYLSEDALPPSQRKGRG
jgi:hypothetical protein